MVSGSMPPIANGEAFARASKLSMERRMSIFNVSVKIERTEKLRTLEARRRVVLQLGKQVLVYAYRICFETHGHRSELRVSRYDGDATGPIVGQSKKN